LNTKKIILSTIAALTLVAAMVSTTAILPQSAYAFSWPCIDRSEGKAPIAVSGNNMYVAWWGNGTGNFDIMFKASNDNGQTFGDKINLSNSTGINSTRAEVEASGNNVYVSWWDTVNGKDQPMMSISHDGGQTFGKPLILTANSTSTSASSTAS
jgi:hypothetical protein